MDKVEDLAAPPIVGRYYLVPCVRVLSKKAVGRPAGWWPVIGPEHEDAQLLSFGQRHFHWDARFLSDAQLRHLTAGGLRGQDSVFTWPLCTTSHAGEPFDGLVRTPQHRRMQCRREQPRQSAALLALLDRRLGDHYADRRVTCGKCPHKGLPLSNLPREPGTNIVTCPGHGLRWDLASGALMRKAVAHGQ